jgi:hypothetical protein
MEGGRLGSKQALQGGGQLSRSSVCSVQAALDQSRAAAMALPIFEVGLNLLAAVGLGAASRNGVNVSLDCEPIPRSLSEPGACTSTDNHCLAYSNAGSILSPSFVPPGSRILLSGSNLRLS